MRVFVLVFLVCLMTVSTACASDKGPVVTAKGEQVLVLNKGKSTPLSQDMFPAALIEGTEFRFCGIGEDDAKQYGVKPGLYIFDRQGKNIVFTPTESAEFVGEVRLSPKGGILAMDSGTSLIRSWEFFSFPGMKPMGEVVYFSADEKPGLIWTGEEGVLFSSMETDEPGRACGYDPCGPVSVMYHTFKDNKTTSLLAGTDLCDYMLAGYQENDGTISVDKLCLQSAKEWEVYPYEDKTPEKMTVKLP